MKNILITICARGGSKGIPNKNISMLMDKPLIYYTINIAHKFAEKFNADISLSTDSFEIKHIAKKFDVETDYIRPKKLSGDNVGKIEVIKDLLIYEEKKRKKLYKYILDLDVTSPLRTLEDLTKAFNILRKNKLALNIVSVSPSRRNPYFNMVELKNKSKFIKLIKSSKNFLTRQSAPKVYELNASFYFYKRKFFNLGFKSSLTDKTIMYLVPHICFDIDEPIDLIFMNCLFKENIIDFEI